MTFVDRERQKRELADLVESGGKRMALLYGRRRVGKTALLKNAWSSIQRVLYYLASDATPEFNRRDLLRTVDRFDDSPGEIRPEDYPTWRTVFDLIFELRPDEPLVVVLDEFQYLVGGEDDVRSQLAAVWDLLDSDRPLVVVLCGSAIRTMEELTGARAPLYGRLDWTCQLHPFDYWHTGRMVPYEGLRTKVLAYTVYGGTPRYLESIAADRSLEENAANSVLAPNGEVRNLVETVVEQERGLDAIHKYKSILAAVAQGRTELSEIANFSGLDYDTALRRKVDKLRELGFLKRRQNFDAPSNAPYRHHLLDPALQFRHSVVAPLQSALETSNPMDLWDDHVAPRLNTRAGEVFETIVQQAYYRLQSERSIPVVSEWGRWEGTDRNRRSLEIDVVARTVDGRMLTGAIKWSTEPVSTSVLADHLRDLERLADSGYAWAHEALEENALFLFVASGGFRQNFHRSVENGDLADQRTLTWTLHDLYSADAAGPENIRPV